MYLTSKLDNKYNWLNLNDPKIVNLHLTRIYRRNSPNRQSAWDKKRAHYLPKKLQYLQRSKRQCFNVYVLSNLSYTAIIFLRD